jgi:hypothetical protein
MGPPLRSWQWLKLADAEFNPVGLAAQPTASHH